ncbi:MULTISPECIES: glycosyltransferase family 2 protein [unclassified Gilliamella]|jgi:hypothetical protein|uniref:glycosyltransferase family 2 protein n=1 Tax=unclassified Gilliamella TaxID=2685620 RepID=UPI00080DC52F|nr:MULTISPECIES: glycosyltransferase [Gilliamella]MCO6550198.1 glycosyltransferase [Gilliamella sp.]NUE96474.1 glycosyltransferase family 2 protein [Gilliamella sp. ESL0232]OCG77177.1 hypothetical protein A9G44_05605 [Gilliamella apicola]
MKITAIIILYNENIKNSKTFESLLNSDRSDITLNVIIWNNGPKALNLQECRQYKSICDSKNINLSIYENLYNIALSKIYNFFINQVSFDFFTILDQDSILNNDFFQNIKINNDFDVIVPQVYSAGWVSKENSLCFPIYHENRKLFDKKVFAMGEIESISSGLTLSNQLIKYISKSKQEFFNERYALYAIDTSFFLDLIELKQTEFKGICVGKISHSLDFNLQDRKKISPMRRLEMEYSKVLNKIFYDKKSRLNVFLYLLRKFTRREYSCSEFLKLAKCLFRKKHPRSCIPLTMNQLL